MQLVRLNRYRPRGNATPNAGQIILATESMHGKLSDIQFLGASGTSQLQVGSVSSARNSSNSPTHDQIAVAHKICELKHLIQSDRLSVRSRQMW